MDDLIQHPSQSSSQNFGKQFVITAKKRDRAPVLNINKVPFFQNSGDNCSLATQQQPALCQAGTEYLKQILSQLQPKCLILWAAIQSWCPPRLHALQGLTKLSHGQHSWKINVEVVKEDTFHTMPWIELTAMQVLIKKLLLYYGYQESDNNPPSSERNA